MNKDLHTSYQYRRVNIKGGSNIVKKRPGPGYMMPLQCLSYKGLKEEEQKNKIHLGQFPYLQGHSIPQASYKEYVYITYALMLMACSGAPLCLMGSLCMVLLNFWIPVGLTLTSCVILLTSL